MSAFPSVQQIDPLSPSAVQNTMGIAANNNATAERGSRERQSNAALKQDSAEKAKYQTFLAGQQTQQLEAQSREAELNRQAEERHAQRQEDLMREMKALDLELDATRIESDAMVDETAEKAKEAKRATALKEKNDTQHEIMVREGFALAAKNKLTEMDKNVETRIDELVTNKFNLVKDLTTDVGGAVGEYQLRLNTDPKELEKAAPLSGIAGLTGRVIDAVKNPGAAVDANPINPLGPVLSGKEVTDEQRRSLILNNVFKDAGTKIAARLGGGEAMVNAFTTLSGGIDAMAAAATPEAKEAARQLIAQSIKAAKDASNGTLDDYTLDNVFVALQKGLTKQALETGLEKKGLAKSETDKRYKDLSKGYTDAANLILNNRDEFTKPSARASSDPSVMVKAKTTLKGYFDVMRDPANADAIIEQVAAQYLTADERAQAVKAIQTIKSADSELVGLRTAADNINTTLTTGDYMGPETRKQVGDQARARASGARDIAARLRGGKKKEE